MRAAESGVDVAIAFAHDGRLGGSVGLEYARRFVGLQNGRQLLDVEHDQLGGVFGEIGIVRKDRGDRLADIAHKSVGEEPLAIRLKPSRRVRRKAIGGIWATSAAVHTACTPGSASAALASMALSFPCAKGERTTRMCNCCGNEISAAKRPRPVSSGRSSRRGTERPTYFVFDLVDAGAIARLSAFRFRPCGAGAFGRPPRAPP